MSLERIKFGHKIFTFIARFYDTCINSVINGIILSELKTFFFVCVQASEHQGPTWKDEFYLHCHFYVKNIQHF